jgi:hypothetical protein
MIRIAAISSDFKFLAFSGFSGIVHVFSLENNEV